MVPSVYRYTVAGERFEHVRFLDIIAVTSRRGGVSRDMMTDVLLPVTIVFALLNVTFGLTSICVGIVACSHSDVLRAHSLSPIWSGIFVSTSPALYLYRYPLMWAIQ